MSTERPILCATDFSTSGARAVDLARLASRALGLPIVLGHAADTGATSSEVGAASGVAEADRVLHQRVAARVSEARRALEREAARCGVPDVSTTLLDGRPWEAIVEHADRIDAELIVIGAHGASGPIRAAREGALGWILGSTADRVVRAARCPVLVAPSTGELRELAESRWITGVALDETSRHALEVAAELARRAGSRVHVVHVAADDRAGEADDRASEAGLLAMIEAVAASAESAASDRLAATSILHGDPAAALVAAAADGVAMVIVGTHARHGVRRALLGSVAERVLRTAATPVLVVPPPGGAG
jgi:nucleotide-binding universal stress UspA family protein